MFHTLPHTARFSPTRRPVGLCVFVWAWCLVAGLHGQENRPDGPDRLVLLDGTIVTGTVTSIRPDGNVILGNAENPLQLNRLRRIERGARASQGGPAANQGGRLVVELLGGGRLMAGGLKISGQKCRIPWQYGEISLPLEAVRAVRLQPERENADFERALAGHGESDRLFARTDEKLVMIEGFIEELDDEQAVFQWNDQRQTIPRARLFGVIMAVVGSVPDHAGQCLLELDDGCCVWGTIESLQTDTASRPANLVFRFNRDAEVTVPWDRVARVCVQSDRLVYVSDLKPFVVDEEPVVAFPRPWQRDRSVGGRRLTLGTRTFSKGIGVQARSRLVLKVEGEFELMTATVGIDAETGGRGDCVFIVLGDGKELFWKHVRGTDPPGDLRVDLRGVKEVTLLVEPGNDLDLGDHADWCDACFIRRPSLVSEGGVRPAL